MRMFSGSIARRKPTVSRTQRSRSTGCTRRIVFWLKSRIWRTRCAARRLESEMRRRFSCDDAGVSGAVCSNSVKPMMLQRMLLKSCAMPAASWPTAASRSCCTASFSRRLRRVMSWWTPAARNGRPSASRTRTLPVSRIQTQPPEACLMRNSAR
jgi:hypothetical protein